MWHQQRYALHAIDITQSIAPASNDSFAWETKPGVGWMSTIVIHSFTRSFSCCHSFIMSCCSCGPGDCFVDTRNCFSRRCDTRESERVQFHVPLHLISACVLRIFACFLYFFYFSICVLLVRLFTIALILFSIQLCKAAIFSMNHFIQDEESKRPFPLVSSSIPCPRKQCCKQNNDRDGALEN